MQHAQTANRHNNMQQGSHLSWLQSSVDIDEEALETALNKLTDWWIGGAESDEDNE